MMMPLLLIPAGVVVVYTLWVLYLAVMNLRAAQNAGTLSTAAYKLGLPVLYFGLFMDFAVNMTVCTVLFLELPKDLLVTARVSRHKFTGTGYRKTMATWFCAHLLDPFDPAGCHCKE